ncbi:hypothetical protein [Ideonella sp.]|uniref:hypothetical protein n=1 Tax=Ideonella sp. TaxID=1929293 RepID=UPI003BB5411A
MKFAPERSSVALFVALTRAVREAPVAEGGRSLAYDVIDRLAKVINTPGFKVELEALIALGAREPVLNSALEPFWQELHMLSSSSSAGSA